MPVWDVFGKRKPEDEFEWAGSIKAPDTEMALILAKETHFRHKEGVAYAVRQRGSEELHVGTYESSMLGGVTDRSYRRQEAYVGVGAKLKRVAGELAGRGLRIDALMPSYLTAESGPAAEAPATRRAPSLPAASRRSSA